MDDMPVQKKSLEVAGLIAEAAVQFVPIVGGSLGVLIGNAARAKHNRSMERWFEILGEAVTRLQVQVDRLLEDSEFIETVAAAATAAGKTTHEEKLEALRNAVLNSASESTRPDEDLRLRFIGLVDQMVPDHFRILTFYNDPKSWIAERKELKLPSISVDAKDAGRLALGWDRQQQSRFNRMCEDLMAWRVLGALPSAMMTPEGFVDRKFTTDDGTEFLKYIGKPAE